jgi:hypothetical protein
MDPDPKVPPSPTSRENPPRFLYGTDVVLEEISGKVRLTLPARGQAMLLAGIAWVALVAWGARTGIAEVIAPWILLVASLPGMFLSVVGIARVGRLISFELDSERFVASGLGMLARTTRIWNRRDIARFKTRDTSAVATESSGTVHLARLLVELRSGAEVVLISQGDGLALGHIAVFLSKGLEGDGPGGRSDGIP